MGKLIEPVVERWAAESIANLLARNGRQLERVLEAAAPGATAELSCQASRKDGGECAASADELRTAGELSQVRH